MLFLSQRGYFLSFYFEMILDAEEIANLLTPERSRASLSQFSAAVTSSISAGHSRGPGAGAAHRPYPAVPGGAHARVAWDTICGVLCDHCTVKTQKGSTNISLLGSRPSPDPPSYPLPTTTPSSIQECCYLSGNTMGFLWGLEFFHSAQAPGIHPSSRCQQIILGLQKRNVLRCARTGKFLS